MSISLPRLSRRDFLAGMALIGTGLGLGCARRPGSRGNPAGWYAWLSDTHIGADPAATRQGQTVAANLHAVIDDILDADDPPRGLLINGDLALDDGQPGDYARLMELLAPLRAAGVPFHFTLGNHDHRGHVRDAIAGAEKRARVVELLLRPLAVARFVDPDRSDRRRARRGTTLVARRAA